MMGSVRERRRETWELAGFVFFVLASSWLLSPLLTLLGYGQIPTALVMMAPFAVSVAFFLRSKETLRQVGWRLRSAKYIAVSLVLPMLLVGLIVLAGYGAGLLSFNAEHPLTRMPTDHLGLNLLLCVPGMFIPWLVLSPPSLLAGWLGHLGEEVAWRGYLFRKTSLRSGVTKGLIVSALVWWAWHLPLARLSPVLRALKVWQLALVMGLSLPALLGTSAMYAWIYMKSRTIWAPTMAHLFWNLLRGALTGRLADGGAGLFRGPLWIINGEGVIGLIVTSLVGLGFFVAARKMTPWEPDAPGDTATGPARGRKAGFHDH